MGKSAIFWAGLTMLLLVLVRPGSQGGSFVQALGSAMTNLVQGVTGQTPTKLG